jgi:ABC-type transport system involved in cytochrome c biogenesis permease component
MRSKIKLRKILGIEVGLNHSWLIAALMALSLGQHFRQTNRDRSTSEIWIAAFLTAALFFFPLPFHELAHSLVAKKRGLK